MSLVSSAQGSCHGYEGFLVGRVGDRRRWINVEVKQTSATLRHVREFLPSDKSVPSRKIDSNKQIFSYREFLKESKILVNKCQAAFLSPFWRGRSSSIAARSIVIVLASIARRYPC